MRQENRARGTYDQEGLEELVDALLEASGRGAAIVVEGVRDRDALRALGAKGPVILASRQSAIVLAEEAARSFQEIIVLTDWDGEGEEMALKIQQQLLAVGACADMEIRSRLKKLVRKEIKDVESLSLYVERMRETYGG
jgi:5S rRNA maturation endonuclease (ribonuclease M5)